MSANIEALVKKHMNESDWYNFPEESLREAVTDQAETHALELRAYEATVQNLEQRIRELEKGRDELRKDAERYRWLRDDAFEHSNDCFMEAGRLFAEKHGVAFDEAIDAAIAQGKGE